MIIDNLKNFSLYEKMDPLFKAAFDFLRSLEGRDLSEGKYSILNDEVYANLFSYDTMEPEKLKYEYHRKYADIHYIRKGEECIYWSRPGIQQPDDYNAETDVGFLTDICGTAIPVREGDVVVLFPEDVHKPKCIQLDSCRVEKVVIKVRLEE